MTRFAFLLAAAALALSAPAIAEAARTHHPHHRHHHRHRRRHHHRHHRRHRRRRHMHRATHVRHLAPATGAGVCQGANLIPDAHNLAAVAVATLCLINRERADHGVPILQEDARLDRTAEGHSDDMVARGYFEHDSPGGQTPLQRIRASGFVPAGHGFVVAENIAWGSLWLATPSEIVRSWMTSLGHRTNILSPAYRFTGMGVAPHVPGGLADGQSGAVYTQDFATLLS